MHVLDATDSPTRCEKGGGVPWFKAELWLREKHTQRALSMTGPLKPLTGSMGEMGI